MDFRVVSIHGKIKNQQVVIMLIARGLVSSVNIKNPGGGEFISTPGVFGPVYKRD
jgi:hypothetical protein